MSAPLRVVQWATGNIGTWSLREVIRHPDLELVGLWVHSAEKAGQDAGALCGLDPVGVVATNDLDEILALRADCVLYMPRQLALDEVCAILASGTNVVTTRGEFQRPASMDAGARDRVEAACAEGGTSVHGTGSSPGFITEAIPLVLTSVQRWLDGLLIEEFADLSGRDSPDLLFQIMGFGQRPEDVHEGRLEHLKAGFAPSLELLADAIGLSLDEVVVDGDLALVARDVEIAAGTVPAGTVGGQRTTITGRRGGQDLLRFRATWFATTELDAAWDLRTTGWRVTLEGDAPMDIEIVFPGPLDQMAGYTANRAVNAVPYVCAAPPGLRTTVDLPQIIPTLA
jgi:2,4-diaminopentanoate dehydrogenase